MSSNEKSGLPTVVILAGGPEIRLSSASAPIPVAMAEIGTRPFIDHQLRLLRKNGVRDVVLCLGHLGGQIKEWVQDGRLYDLNVTYSFDGPKLLGTGGALKKALPLLTDPFIVLYGDHFLMQPFSEVWAFYKNQTKPHVMSVFKNTKKFSLSNVSFKDGKILDYDKEYPSQEMDYADYGLSVLKASAFDQFKQKDHFSLSSVFQSLLSQDLLGSFIATEHYYEIGTSEGFKDFNRFFLKKRFKTGIFP